MKPMKTVLAAATALVALAALPALAAAQPELEIGEGASPHFTFHGGTVEFTIRPGTVVHCTTFSGTIEFAGNPSEMGDFRFAVTGCKSSGTSCGTEKASTGEIEVGPLDFHLVTATDVEGGEPVDAMLITPNEPDPETTTGNFTTFKCAFGLVKVEIDGTGLIGEVTSPDTNKASETFEVEFAQNGEEETQTYEHIEVEGETSDHTYDLEGKVGSGEFETATLTGAGIATCTEGENTLIEG